MAHSKHNPEHRYYLLPGMGRCNRRHRQAVFRWCLVFGVLISLLFGALLYLLNRPH